MSRVLPDPVVPSRDLPASVDVAIIGGGIAGASTALWLAERGVSVALFEKGLIGAEQSGRNWGWVRQMGRDPAELPLAIESLKLWKGLAGRGDEDVGFRQTGIAYVCRNERQAAVYEAWLSHAKAFGLDSRMLRGAELVEQVAGITDAFPAALYTGSDGRAEPFKATPAIARIAMRSGAQVFTGCAVRSVELSAGRVSGVVTERGRVTAATVVLAGGAWSRLFAGNLGVDFPQLKILGSVARTTSIEGVADFPVGGDNFAFRRRQDGGFTIAMRNANIAPIVPDSFRLFFDYMPTLIKSWGELKLRIGTRFIEEWNTPTSWAADVISPFERVRILDPVPTEAFNRQGLAHLSKAFPAFANARIVQTWGGLIDVTPDAIPVIGPVPSIPGFHIASGLSGHGFGLGPGVGRLMAEIVMGETPCVDPTPYRFERFNKREAASRAGEVMRTNK